MTSSSIWYQKSFYNKDGATFHDRWFGDAIFYGERLIELYQGQYETITRYRWAHPDFRRKFWALQLTKARVSYRARQLMLAVLRCPVDADKGDEAERAYFAACKEIYGRVRYRDDEVREDLWRRLPPLLSQAGIVEHEVDEVTIKDNDLRFWHHEGYKIMVDELIVLGVDEDTAKARAAKYKAWNLGRLSQQDAHLSLREPFHRDNWGWDVGFSDLRVTHLGQELEVNVSDDDDDVYEIVNMPTDLAAGDIHITWNDPQARPLIKATSDQVKIGVTSGNQQATRTIRIIRSTS